MMMMTKAKDITWVSGLSCYFNSGYYTWVGDSVNGQGLSVSKKVTFLYLFFTP